MSARSSADLYPLDLSDSDQDGLGIAFPSTSGVEGYTAEKEKAELKQSKVAIPGALR